MTTGINKVLDKEPSIIKSKKNLKAFKGVHYKIDKKLQLYENGAHFKYSELCNKLEILLKSSEINTNCETALLTYSDKVNDNKSINKMLNIVNDDCPNGNRLNSVFNSKDSNKFKNISKRSVKNSKNASSKFASNKLLNAVTSENNVLNVNTDLKTFDTYDSIKIETKKDLIDIKNNYDKKNISNNKNMISNSNLNIKKANKQNDNIKYNSTSIENNKTESYILNKNFKSIDKNISKNNTALQRENSKKNIIINSINSIKNISNIIVNKDNAGNTKLKEPMLKNNIKKIKVINKQPENLDIILPKINTGLKANTNTNNNTNKVDLLEIKTKKLIKNNLIDIDSNLDEEKKKKYLAFNQNVANVFKSPNSNNTKIKSLKEIKANIPSINMNSVNKINQLKNYIV